MKRIVFIILTLFFIPNIVWADGTDKYYIDAYVNSDGSVTFKEYVSFNGEYNYLERNLVTKGNNKKFTGEDYKDFIGTDIYNAGLVEVNCMSSLNKNLSNDFNYSDLKKECFTKEKYANKGENGVYTEDVNNNNYNYKIYNPSFMNKDFYLEYTVNDLVVVHNDIAELLFNFTWSEDIDEVKIRVVLPENTNELRVFSHGPYNGSNEILSSNKVMATWDYLSGNTDVDIRVVFDKEIVFNATKKSGVGGLDKILAYESEMANIANQERQKSRIFRGVLLGIGITWIIIGIILIIKYRNKINEYNKKYNYNIYREIPNTYGPEILGYLLTNNNISSNYLSASILELIRRKIFIIKKLKNNDEWEISLNKEDDTITSSESKLIKWLITEVGDGQKFTNKDLKRASKKTSFNTKFENWKDDVIGEGSKFEFFEDINKGSAVIYFIISVLLFILYIFWEMYIVSVVGIIVAISLLLVTSKYKRSDKGANEYAKWMGFKKFLLEFGRMDEKDLPEVYLWEKYLVYATSLGIADKVSKILKVRINNMSDSEFNDLPILYCYNMGFGDSITNSIVSSCNNAVTSASIASSSNSSSGGFGGGASFGGGGGGFGGGGGRG